MLDEAVSKAVLGAAIEVHRALGPGLLESTYQRCLMHELELRGLVVLAEVPLGLVYKGLVVDGAYRIDLLVEDAVVVEVKDEEAVLDVVDASSSSARVVACLADAVQARRTTADRLLAALRDRGSR